MAFDGLYEFTDRIAARYTLLEKRRNESTGADELSRRLQWSAEQATILDMLYSYYDTVLKHGKFKDQKRYCLKMLEQLNPAQFKGYFNKK